MHTYKRANEPFKCQWQAGQRRADELWNLYRSTVSARSFDATSGSSLHAESYVLGVLNAVK